MFSSSVCRLNSLPLCPGTITWMCGRSSRSAMASMSGRGGAAALRGRSTRKSATPWISATGGVGYEWCLHPRVWHTPIAGTGPVRSGQSIPPYLNLINCNSNVFLRRRARPGGRHGRPPDRSQPQARRLRSRRERREPRPAAPRDPRGRHGRRRRHRHRRRRRHRHRHHRQRRRPPRPPSGASGAPSWLPLASPIAAVPVAAVLIAAVTVAAVLCSIPSQPSCRRSGTRPQSSRPARRPPTSPSARSPPPHSSGP